MINLIITDNEEVSVSTALKGLGHNLSIIRQQHWEIETDGSNENIMKEIYLFHNIFIASVCLYFPVLLSNNREVMTQTFQGC